MKPVRTVQIGTSLYSHGAPIWRTIKYNPKYFEVAGYALPENEREKFPQLMSDFDGYKELTVDEILNDPQIEAVVVETEEKYLTKYALLAAKHGKHIHLEKPGGFDVKEFEELVKTAKANNTVLHLGYMYRYNPYVQNLKNRIHAGELGEIISIEAQMNGAHPVIDRNWLGELPGGMMFFLGGHLIDFILQLQGVPEKIIPLNKCTGINGITAEDFGMAVFEYKNGVSFVKTAANEVGAFSRRHLTVCGTKGTVVIEPLEMPCENGNYSEMTMYNEPDTWQEIGKKERIQGFKRYGSMMTSFAEMVRGDKINPWDYDYELLLNKTLMKVCGKE